MNEACDRCGPRSGRRTAWSGSASFTCADTARASNVRRSPLRAGTIWPLGVRMHSRRKLVPRETYLRPLDDAA